jgi:hypothetical protein
MRPWLIPLAAIALAGCAGADRVDATAPTVSYEVDSQLEYEQAAQRADEYCEDHYDGDARLVGAEDDYFYDGDETVTFACTRD